DPQIGNYPGEISGLLIAPDRITISWNAVPGPSVPTYDVVRGFIGELQETGSVDAAECFASMVAMTSVTDSSTPPLGNGRYYLVRATAACGEGSFGSNSGGGTRRPFSCP